MPAEVTISKKSKPRKPRPNTPHGRTDGHHTPTRKEQLIELLGRKAGTDVPTMCKMFGWQPHTARAALAAPELEKVVADLIRTHLDAPGALLSIVPDCTAGEIAGLQAKVQETRLTAKLDDILQLVTRVDLAPGSIAITMNAASLAEKLSIGVDRISSDLPAVRAPFRLRKRGVETRLVVNGAARPVDKTLLANIAQAHVWFGMITAGRTYADIAEAAGTSKRRVQQILDLAFLAPDIVRDVLSGQQPTGFTSDWALRHELPSDWNEQRRLLATL